MVGLSDEEIDALLHRRVTREEFDNLPQHAKQLYAIGLFHGKSLIQQIDREMLIEKRISANHWRLVSLEATLIIFLFWWVFIAGPPSNG